MRALLLPVFIVAACGGRVVSPDERDTAFVYACPVPKVFCNEAPPECAPGAYPEPTVYKGGDCKHRCWTGRCEPCATECMSDADCTVVGIQLGGGDSWSCIGAVAAPVAECQEDPGGCSSFGFPVCVCTAFARCEGGSCTLAHECEPDCTGTGMGCPP